MKHVIQACLATFAEHYPDVKVPPIVMNKRLRRRAGQYAAKRTGEPVRIDLSPHYLTTEERFKDVLLHELAHLAVGIDAGHGPRWQAAVTRLGGSTSETHDYKLSFVCIQCGAEHMRLLPRRGHYWACTACNMGRLELLSAKTKQGESK